MRGFVILSLPPNFVRHGSWTMHRGAGRAGVTLTLPHIQGSFEKFTEKNASKVHYGAKKKKLNPCSFFFLILIFHELSEDPVGST